MLKNNLNLFNTKYSFFYWENITFVVGKTEWTAVLQNAAKFQLFNFFNTKYLYNTLLFITFALKKRRLIV